MHAHLNPEIGKKDLTKWILAFSRPRPRWLDWWQWWKPTRPPPPQGPNWPTYSGRFYRLRFDRGRTRLIHRHKRHWRWYWTEKNPPPHKSDLEHPRSALDVLSGISARSARIHTRKTKGCWPTPPGGHCPLEKAPKAEMPPICCG